MKAILDLKACPYCEQEDPGIMGGIVREQIKLGNIGSDVVGHVSAAIYTIIDLRRPPLAGARVPAVKIYTDFCKKCGRAYNFLIEQGHATLPLRQGDVPTFS